MGPAVGDTEGPAEGEAVGPAVGELLGPLVGAPVGGVEGAPVGPTVGPVDGGAVGAAEGVPVGADVGVVAGEGVMKHSGGRSASMASSSHSEASLLMMDSTHTRERGREKGAMCELQRTRRRTTHMVRELTSSPPPL